MSHYTKYGMPPIFVNIIYFSQVVQQSSVSLYPVINIVIYEHEDPICNFDSNDIITDDVIIFLSFALMMIYALL